VFGILRLMDVETRLAEAVAALNAATAAVVGVLSEVFATGAWEVPGIRSREQWVMWQVGCSRTRAAGLVALATRRVELPATAARFEAGELSEDHAVAIAKRVPVDRDEVTAEIAPMLTYPQLRRALRSMPPIDDAAPPPVRVVRNREVSFWYDDGGWFHGRWCLPADEGAVLEQALCRGRDELFEADPSTTVTWADALVAMAGRDTTVKAVGRDNYVVNLFVDVDREDTPTWLHLGPFLDREVRRVHTCDGTVRALLRERGEVVAKGRSTRVVGTALRRLVIERDGGCRHPLCGSDRFLDAHHLWHWEDGGPTDPSNLVCLCRAHHRAHHRGEFTITGDPEAPDGLEFRTRAGQVLRPPPRPPGDPPDPPPGWEHPLGVPAPREALEWAAA
jgi:hypothetical protein